MATIKNTSSLKGLERLIQAIEDWALAKGWQSPFISHVRLEHTTTSETYCAKLILSGTNSGSIRLSADNPQLEQLNDDFFLQETLDRINPMLEQAFHKMFYEENYEVMASFIFDNGKRIDLDTNGPKVCRFCKASWPVATFKTQAHAIPASIGNNFLFSKTECDSCNHFFGTGIEFHFGNWSLSQRIFGLVPNKNSFPSLKDGDYSIEIRDDVTEIRLGSSGLTLSVSDDHRKILVTVPKRKYVPVAVFKAFVKMAISLMPAEEVSNFAPAIKWLMESDHSIAPENASFLSTCYRTFFGGSAPKPHVLLLKRKVENKNFPYLTLIVGFGSSTYQIVVPAPLEFQNDSPTLPPFSRGYDSSQPLDFKIIDFANAGSVATEAETFVLDVQGTLASELAEELAKL